MSGSVNKAILIGMVGQDPKIGQAKSGFKYASLSLATSKKWKDKQGEKQVETTWHNISILGEMSKVCDWIKKGDQLYIEGEIKQEEYSEKETGEVRKITKIVATQIQILNSKNSKEDKTSQHQQDKQNGYQKQPEIKSNDFDEIPF